MFIITSLCLLITFYCHNKGIANVKVKNNKTFAILTSTNKSSLCESSYKSFIVHITKLAIIKSNEETLFVHMPNVYYM